jgi:hypothetical protein
MRNSDIDEVDFKEAVEISKRENKSLIWLGREPVSYISELLGLDAESFSKKDPEEIVYMDKEGLKQLDGCVLICYHGNTSGFISKFLKKQHAIRSHSLKGGITAVVGEVF